jgi:hypothetical protein
MGHTGLALLLVPVTVELGCFGSIAETKIFRPVSRVIESSKFLMNRPVLMLQREGLEGISQSTA